jgi:hypothetical protein
MKIVSDHGFPKGSMPDDDAFDRFKNEREYVAQSGKMKTTVAAMDWAAAEIDRLRDMCINREEFIANNHLWREFSQYLSEPHAADAVGNQQERGK